MQALPRMARAVSSNPDAYVYLAESIRRGPISPTSPVTSPTRLGQPCGGATCLAASWRSTPRQSRHGKARVSTYA